MYRVVRARSTRSGAVDSSRISAVQPRWPRIRPPRTWKTCTEASSSSWARPIRSASVASDRTTEFFSITFSSAWRSSRRLAAVS